MKKIKVYRCGCGEEFYEDDAFCINCQKPVDKARFREVEVMEVIKETGVTVEEKPFVKPKQEAWKLAFVSWLSAKEGPNWTPAKGYPIDRHEAFRAGWAACCKAMAEVIQPGMARAYEEFEREIEKLVALGPKP